MVWVYWLEEQWNHPDRTDHYLMRLTHETVYSNATRKPRTIDLGPYKIPFVKQKAPAKPVTPTDEVLKQKIQWSKAFWLGIQTMPVRSVTEKDLQ